MAEDKTCKGCRYERTAGYYVACEHCTRNPDLNDNFDLPKAQRDSQRNPTLKGDN